MPSLASLPPHVIGFFGFLLLLFLYFVFRFVLPAIKVWRDLAGVARRIKPFESNTDSILADNLDSLNKCFDPEGTVLKHLWNEYSETLHPQSRINPANGQSQVIQIRSTIPAEAFFRSEIIVDVPLGTDFFKHLPGIFTGIGIIGTFTGLLLGLLAFKITEDPLVVRDSLKSLLNGVSEAFLVSVVAIFLAMVITFVEKWLISKLNAKVEKLVQAINALFKAGAGEEYLSRMVAASESAASQTAILKDALVTDLRQILTELTEKQIAASKAANTELGELFGQSLEQGLKNPLTQIADAFKGVRNDQGTAIQSMLTDVLSGFGQKIEDLFGGQIAGINGLQQQTIQALQAAVVQLQEMGGKIDAAGKEGASAMAAKLAESMAAAEARQRVMNDKMTEFVDQIRSTTAESQGETHKKLQVALTAISTQMNVVTKALFDRTKEAETAGREYQEKLGEESQRAVGILGTQVGAVVDGVNQAVAQMKHAVEAMRTTTGDALSKLNSGADTLYVAATDFKKAGDGVATTLSQSGAVATQLYQASASVASASSGLSGFLADYKVSREVMAEMLKTLQAVVDKARHEASLSGDVLAKIDSAAEKLGMAGQTAESYLGQVSSVIDNAHSEFTEGMTRAVAQANRDFHQELTKSVGLLRDGIQELEAVFETVTLKH